MIVPQLAGLINITPALLDMFFVQTPLGLQGYCTLTDIMNGMSFNQFELVADMPTDVPANETDPVFSAWIAASPPLYTETDPVFSLWLSTTPPVMVELDPVYLASIAAGITSSDILNWNSKMDTFTPGNTGSMIYRDGASWTDTAPLLNHGLIYSGSDIRMQASATSYCSMGPGGIQISDISAGSGSYSVDNLDLFANGIGEAKLGNDGDNNMLLQLTSFNTYGASGSVLKNDDNASYVFSAFTGTTFGTDTSQSFLGVVMDNVGVRQLNDGDVLPCNGMLIGTLGIAPIVMGTNDIEQVRIDIDGIDLLQGRYYTDISDTNATKFVLKSPNLLKEVHMSVDQLWDVGAVYTDATKLELWANGWKRASLGDNGLNLSTISAYADNASAITGGLAVGDIYYTNVAGDGILKIVI